MLRKWSLSFVIVALLCLTLALPAIGAESDSLVTAQELNSLLDKDGVVIVDVRKAGYEEGHIPGAVSVQKTDFYETINGVKSMAASPELFSATLSSIGADNNSRIIVYSDDLKYATRFWWVLHMYGHQNAQVLDGGIDAWTAAGYELSTQPATPAPAEYNLTADDVNSDVVATTEEVKATRTANTVIVDCRNNDYFNGKKAKAARSGHIAGAILISASDNLKDDGTFKSAEELAKLYAAKGIIADTPVITYCNTGTTATLHYLVLTQILGYTNVQNYDASLTGWAADPSLPMERYNSLATAQELNSLLDKDGVVIVDVRKAGYEEGHIPGAVSVQKTDFYETINGVKSMAASPELFSATLSRIGADKNSQIIVYSDDLKYATRFWWVLHMYGHQNAQVLDGGIDAWTAAGYELSTQPAAPAPAEYTLTADDANSNVVATTEEVIAARAANDFIVDARNTDYFQGKKTKVARSGHIAGAILIGANENLNDDGTLKTAEELAQVYAAKGITADTPVITFCNTGTTATVNYLALTQVLGYTKVQNYDASLTYWAADSTLPMDSNYDFFTIGSDQAEVNATLLQLQAVPCIKNDRSFVPAKALAAGLGTQLTESGNTITLTANDITLQLTIGDTNLKVNGTDRQMDAAPFTVNEFNFLPIRWIAEAFGAEVGWNAEKQQVSVGLLQ